MDTLIQQLMIADGDRTALRAPRFRIADQLAARRRQVLLRLAPDAFALAEARGAVPNRKAFIKLQQRGHALRERLVVLRAQVHQAQDLTTLYALAEQADVFGRNVTEYANDVERTLRAAAQERDSKGRVIIGAVVVAAGVATVALLRKRRDLQSQVSTLQRRLVELPGRLTGFTRAKRLRSKVQTTINDADALQMSLQRRTSIVALGELEKGVKLMRDRTASLELEVTEFIAKKRAIARAIDDARTERKEQARDRIFKRRKEQPAVRPPLYIYVTARDERVRSNHAAFDGFILTRDAFLARNIMPPNGFNCRCTLVKLDKARSDRLYDEQAARLGSEEKAIAYFENRPIPRGAFRDPGFE